MNIVSSKNYKKNYHVETTIAQRTRTLHKESDSA